MKVDWSRIAPTSYPRFLKSSNLENAIPRARFVSGFLIFFRISIQPIQASLGIQSGSSITNYPPLYQLAQKCMGRTFPWLARLVMPRSSHIHQSN
jgi:hypothetical protein